MLEFRFDNFLYHWIVVYSIDYEKVLSFALIFSSYPPQYFHTVANCSLSTILGKTVYFGDRYLDSSFDSSSYLSS